MYRYSVDNAVTYTPTDFLLFRESPFAVWMERLTLENPDHGSEPDEPAPPPLDDAQPQDQIVESLRDEDRDVVLVAWEEDEPRRRADTLDAMRSGADFIVNGMLALGPLAGTANLLMRTSGYSDFGDYLYIPCDTQGADTLETTFRLCFLADLLHSLQGQLPPQMLVIRDDANVQSLQTEDHIHYYRAVKKRFMDAMVNFRNHRMPDPAEALHFGRWASCARDTLKRRATNPDYQLQEIEDIAAEEHLEVMAPMARTAGSSVLEVASPHPSGDVESPRASAGAVQEAPTLAEQARLLSNNTYNAAAAPGQTPNLARFPRLVAEQDSAAARKSSGFSDETLRDLAFIGSSGPAPLYDNGRAAPLYDDDRAAPPLTERALEVPAADSGAQVAGLEAPEPVALEQDPEPAEPVLGEQAIEVPETVVPQQDIEADNLMETEPRSMLQTVPEPEAVLDTISADDATVADEEWLAGAMPPSQAGEVSEAPAADAPPAVEEVAAAEEEWLAGAMPPVQSPVADKKPADADEWLAGAIPPARTLVDDDAPAVVEEWLAGALPAAKTLWADEAPATDREWLSSKKAAVPVVGSAPEAEEAPAADREWLSAEKPAVPALNKAPRIDDTPESEWQWLSDKKPAAALFDEALVAEEGLAADQEWLSGKLPPAQESVADEAPEAGEPPMADKALAADEEWVSGAKPGAQEPVADGARVVDAAPKADKPLATEEAPAADQEWPSGDITPVQAPEAFASTVAEQEEPLSPFSANSTVSAEDAPAPTLRDFVSEPHIPEPHIEGYDVEVIDFETMEMELAEPDLLPPGEAADLEDGVSLDTVVEKAENLVADSFIDLDSVPAPTLMPVPAAQDEELEMPGPAADSADDGEADTPRNISSALITNRDYDDIP